MRRTVVDYEAPNWKLRRRIYENDVLISTDFPGTPRGLYACQQLMCAEGVADVTQYGFKFSPVAGVALSSTSLNVRKDSTNKRREYDVLPV